MHISDNTYVPAGAHPHNQPADALHPDTAAKITFREIGILHDVSLKVAVCPLDKQDDITYCLQNCDLPDNFFIALVNNIKLFLSPAQHLPEATLRQRDSLKHTDCHNTEVETANHGSNSRRIHDNES